MTKADLAQLALAQVGTWCYVWGGNGQDMTAMTDDERESWIERRESEEANQERVRTLYAKLVEQGVELIRGGDCSGFVYWCMSTLGLWTSDCTADGMYKSKTNAVERDALQAGDLAFRVNDSGKATHVGVYVGDGYFVHSKGRDDGVVKEESSSSYWQAYGSIKDFEKEPEPEPEPEPSPDPKKYVKFLGSVNCRQNPLLASKCIYIAHKGEYLPYLADYVDGRGCTWYAVELKNGDSAFCSAFTGKSKKYTEVVEL